MIIVLMGVTGCGKSTVGRALAQRLNVAMLEGDDFHPPANRQKMEAGQPLTDDDRIPWLAALHEAMARLVREGRGGVVACSALRKRYREALAVNLGHAVRFVYLKLTPEQATDRLKARTGHFMPASLVPSQFQTLEAPAADEAVIIDATLPPDQIIVRVLADLDLR